MPSVCYFDPISRYEPPPKRCTSDVGRVEHGCRSLEAGHADCCDYQKRVLTFQGFSSAVELSLRPFALWWSLFTLKAEEDQRHTSVELRDAAFICKECGYYR
jgi:hypothetical protein